MKVFYGKLMFFCLLLFSFTAHLVLNGQTKSQNESHTDYNYLKFKSEFEKEFGTENDLDLNDTTSSISQVFFKTKLPKWLYNIPESNKSIIYAIGVSEPGMTPDSAKLLAILRAKAICAMITRSKMTGLSDYYISEKDLKSGDIISSIYREFNKIVSKLTFNNSDFSIVEESFTNNNEAIVLASLVLGKELTSDTAGLTCLAEVSSSYIKRNSKYSTTSRIELMAGEKSIVKSVNNYFYYVVKYNNKSIRILADFLGNSLPENSGKMTYESDISSENNKEQLRISCSLQYGLWYALSTVLLQTMVIDYQEANVEQSNLTDHHTKLKQNINRISSQKEVSLRIKGLHVKNNTLSIETEFITQN